MFQKGLYYQRGFLKGGDRNALLSYLESLWPIWEQRFSTVRPLKEGERQRRLLRPVYWLGNWQFACLDYYRPPKGTRFRCVRAEPYPPVLQKLVNQMESLARKNLHPKDFPKGWHLNTCLVNFYGSALKGEKWEDAARVGEHRDFEPGPVASLSLGERAVFQFVKTYGRDRQSQVVVQQWLEDGSLQIFGGERFKNQLFHRVQRVEKKAGFFFPLPVSDFRTRRVNLTFRYVPEEHIQPFKEFPKELQADIEPYMQELAEHSAFFAKQIQDHPKVPRP